MRLESGKYARPIALWRRLRYELLFVELPSGWTAANATNMEYIDPFIL